MTPHLGIKRGGDRHCTQSYEGYLLRRSVNFEKVGQIFRPFKKMSNARVELTMFKSIWVPTQSGDVETAH